MAASNTLYAKLAKSSDRKYHKTDKVTCMLCFEDFIGVNIIQSRCWKNHCRRLHKDFIKDRMIKVRWELYATFIYYIFIILCNITICDKRN